MEARRIPFCSRSIHPGRYPSRVGRPAHRVWGLKAADAVYVANSVAALPASPAVFYVVTDEAGQAELLAGAIRRHLPGEAGRRRARAYLRRETTELVPRLIGRAWADLQYRLAEATRQLVRAVEARYAEGTGRLERALHAATAQWETTAGETARRDRELAARQQALDRIGALLDTAAPPALREHLPDRVLGAGVGPRIHPDPEHR
jgi:hypothetical protein